MSTIQEIEKRIHQANLKSRASQVIDQVKKQTGKGSIIGIRPIVRKRAYKLLRRIKRQYPRGTAFKRLQRIEADRYIERMLDEEK